jgi:hypothetical protein
MLTVSFQIAFSLMTRFDHKSMEAIAFAQDMDLHLEGPHQQIVEEDGDEEWRLERSLFWT